MQNENPKEGVSVKEIEKFAKNNRFKLFLCLAFLLACFFSYVFFQILSLVLAAVGGILGVLLPSQVELCIEKIRAFCEKQENVTQLILGCVGLIVSIFLPLITFFVLGTAGGKALGTLRKTT
jgi:hypothetical protein